MSMYTRMFVRDVTTAAEISFAAMIVLAEMTIFFGAIHYVSV